MFNMNLSLLKEYLDNLVTVVNQHARLLHTINQEMQLRTSEKQMGDLFMLIAAGLPYDSLVKKIGGVPPTRRGSLVKLLGDNSLLPKDNVGVSVIGGTRPRKSSGSGFDLAPKDTPGP